MLEAEVVEINRDIDYCEQCLRKYGEWFNSPLQYLRELKRTKKNKMCVFDADQISVTALCCCGGGGCCCCCRSHRVQRSSHALMRPPALLPMSFLPRRRKEIIRTMESFNNNLQGGKKLVKSLEKQMPVSVLQAPSTPAVIAATAGGDDAPELLVGSAVSGGRVIRPVES